MRELLPVGTYVRVQDPGCVATNRWTGEILPDCWIRQPREYYAIVVGYDLGRTKYEVGPRFGGWNEWLFMKGGNWTFPAWCVEVTEDEAKALPAPKNAAEA